ncbi:MAG: polysaccharide deacetylase family protein [Brevinematales bacterium]
MKRLGLGLIMVIFILSCQSGGSVKKKELDYKADKICALTFDDGPSTDMTPKVLEKLEKHGVVATFFVIGMLINEDTQPVLKRMVNMGCEIGNHSWAWDSMNTMPKEKIKESIDKTTAAIKKYANVTPKFFRPPNLAVSETMYEVIDLPFAEGVLGFDWAGCERTPEKIAQNVLKDMRDGAIILLHDVQPAPHPTPEALDIIIPELKKQGYEFVTLSELFKRKGVDPKSAKNRMWKYVF